MSTDWLGWASALILFSTVTWQALRQWRTENSDGVSPLLFIGQMVASAGFLAYAATQGDTVFVVTNVLMIGSAVLGLACVIRDRMRKRRAGDSGGEAAEGPAFSARARHVQPGEWADPTTSASSHRASISGSAGS